MTAEPVRIAIDDTHGVGGLLLAPKDAAACYVFAHGAGAGMSHAFMDAFAADLAAVRIATLRYQFPYMERGSRRPDAPADAHAAVRAAVAHAHRSLPRLPLIAGGKSYGGRMTSQAQAITRLDGVRGLAFVGFPLHPAGKPAVDRAAHLREVTIPMLFLSGTRDELADVALLRGVVDSLAARATLRLFDDADHSLHVLARSGRKDADVRRLAAAAMAEWMLTLSPAGPGP